MHDIGIKVGQIIDALTKRAKRQGFQKRDRSQWFKAAKGILGETTPDTLDFTKKVTFGRIFGLGDSKNLSKYRATSGRCGPLAGWQDVDRLPI